MADTITMEALRQRLDAGERLTILDVRDKDDFAEWHIPGAKNCDAYEALGEGKPGPIQDVELPREEPVVAVCYKGNTSRIAADTLQERGFRAVSLAGGMQAWSGAWNTAELEVGGANVVQVRRTGKGCLSYIVGSAREAAVIDPSLDASIYIDIATRHGWSIRHVVETHVHADHLSRARALCDATGAALHMPRTERVHFATMPVDEGTRIRVGSHELVALRTPGHTDESTCYHLAGKALFTGDTLFLDSVGRPDLEADKPQTTARAAALHQSLQRILTLDPSTLIFPCHVSEPIPFDKKPLVAPLRDVRARTAMLALPRDAFVERILTRIPATPPNHKVIVRANEAGDASGLGNDVEAGANRCAVN